MENPSKIFGRLGNSLFQYATLYALARENNVDYYFQDEKWWKSYESEVKQLFGSGIEHIDMVSIHVRRAGNPINPNEPEYSKNPFYVDLIKDGYYERAMELFPNEDFLVFSDDIKFCRQYFKGKRFTFCKEKDEIKALNLIASCKAHIMANSSFSWWGSYLGGGKTVAPLAWYADGQERTKLLDEWITL